MCWASTWFLLPVNVAYVLFAAALVTQDNDFSSVDPEKGKKPCLRLWPVAFLALAVPLCAGGAYVTYQTARNVTNMDVQPLSAQEAMAHPESCAGLYDDFGAGGLHLAVVMTSRLRYVTGFAEKLADPKKIDKDDKPEEMKKEIAEGIPALNRVFCASALYMKETKAVTLRLRIARLLMRSEVLISLDPYLDDATRAYYYAGWNEELKDLLKRYPSRIDLTVTYFLWHIIHGQEDKSQPLLDFILMMEPDHPVSLWFDGLEKLKNDQTAGRGLGEMKKALTKGIERYMPVDPALKNQLENLP